MERDKYFSSSLYNICEGLSSFHSSETQNKLCSIVRKKLYLSLYLKNGHSRMTFRTETEDGKVCKCCSKLENNDFMQEASFVRT